LSVFVLVTTGAVAQINAANFLAAADGLAKTGSSAWGIVAYPAAMAGQLNGAMLSVYGEKRFLTDLSVFHLACSGELAGRNWLAEIRHEGTSFFASDAISIATAQPVSGRMDLSLQLGYLSQRIQGYGSTGQVAAGLGAVFRCTDKLTWGVHMQAEQATEAQAGTYRIRTGMGYSVSPLAMLTIEAVAEPGTRPDIISSFHYFFRPGLVSRFGYASSLSTFSFSQGFGIKGLDLEISGSYHLALGLSAGLSLNWKFRSKS